MQILLLLCLRQRKILAKARTFCFALMQPEGKDHAAQGQDL